MIRGAARIWEGLEVQRLFFFSSFQSFITFLRDFFKHGEMRVHIKSSPAPNFGFLILIMWSLCL